MPKKQENEPAIGHNGGTLTASQKQKFNGYIAQIQKNAEEQRDLSSETALIYRAAKDEGFDTKAMRDVVRLLRMDKDHRDLRILTVEMYLQALGQLADTPLGRAAMTREGFTGDQTAAP